MRHFLILLVCSIGVTLSAFFCGAWATTFIVSPDGQGLFPNLQSAIDAAAPGDTVLALPGTYKGPGNRGLDFYGKDICFMGQDGSMATVLDCEHLDRAASFSMGETKLAVFQGFSIINAGDGETNGGGIRCEEAEPTIRDIRITDAYAQFVGGIDIVHASPEMSDIIITECTMPGAGGGIGLYWADSTIIRNCILSNNSVNGYGGGIEANNGLVTLENVHFIGNHAGISGGGLSAHGSTIVATNCLFSGNDARDGAGVSVRGSTLILQDCTFIANYAWRWGAAIYYDTQGDPSDGLVENCDFRGNNSTWGGIIQLMNSADPVLRNLTVVGNNHGDGISAGCCTIGVVVENCLVAFNQGGYGINTDPSGQSWLWPVCSNIYGNEYGEYANEDQTAVNGNISADPRLCDPSYEILGVADCSPCLPENNYCGVLMGNHGEECTLTAVGAPAPPGVALEANYPNPFNPSTTIPFRLEAPTAVTLGIHDVSGRLVRVLAEGSIFPAGSHELRWDGRDGAGRPAPSGVYFYRLETPAGATARPMLLVK